ncbi:hypothetical protein HK097_007230 [Rhizophlyctis rosea]|uniref:Uracil-DNA glycosylase n=1 Tax=Rhizophlyctis rosea TaxID=64517 RepID=A0AAD5SDF3_9FUNG|nr:hypothetical protein HK097_007230 [Rhizophlyctis rosea]
MIRKYFQPVEKPASETPAKKRRVDEEGTAVSSEPTSETSVESGLPTAPPSPNGDASPGTSTAQTEENVKSVSEQKNDTMIEEEKLRLIEEKRQKALAILATKQLLKLERDTMAEDWLLAFKSEIEKPYFAEIKRTLETQKAAGKIIYPEPNEIYTFTKCPLTSVKVVILGQDPYHGPGQAHGLCFSVKKPVRSPPSLNNIFTELQSDLGAQRFQKPSHGCLEGWCTEGVLLLNASLTVRKGEPNSHASIGWMKFTDAIVSYINKNNRNVVFMLWGGFAQKKGGSIDKKRHLVLKATHPSPLGANKGGWFGCKHFSKANEYLKNNGIKPVDWNHLP